jgi:hypothetical protein
MTIQYMEWELLLLHEGRNVFHNTLVGAYYINVDKMYSFYDGICYTIASNMSMMNGKFFPYYIKLSESISESKIPSSINGILLTPDERYGSVYRTKTGTSLFS